MRPAKPSARSRFRRAGPDPGLLWLASVRPASPQYATVALRSQGIVTTRGKKVSVKPYVSTAKYRGHTVWTENYTSFYLHLHDRLLDPTVRRGEVLTARKVSAIPDPVEIVSTLNLAEAPSILASHCVWGEGRCHYAR